MLIQNDGEIVRKAVISVAWAQYILKHLPFQMFIIMLTVFYTNICSENPTIWAHLHDI